MRKDNFQRRPVFFYEVENIVLIIAFFDDQFPVRGDVKGLRVVLLDAEFPEPFEIFLQLFQIKIVSTCILEQFEMLSRTFLGFSLR